MRRLGARHGPPTPAPRALRQTPGQGEQQDARQPFTLTGQGTWQHLRRRNPVANVG
jgi:hypothetical protein